MALKDILSSREMPILGYKKKRRLKIFDGERVISIIKYILNIGYM